MEMTDRSLSADARSDLNLIQLLVKLVLNSSYGTTLMQSTSFSTSSIVTENHLKNKTASVEKMAERGIMHINIVGFCKNKVKKKKKKDHVNLIYSITTKSPHSSINNIPQLGTAILSSSRLCFLGMIHKLLKYYDPRKLEISYTDTDSILTGSTSANLRSLMLPSLSEDEKDEIEKSLFQDEFSTKEQSGLLKREGYPT